MTNLTDEQKHTLLHMTGLDRAKEPYRTHFATDPGTPDWETLQSLVALGLVHPGVKSSDVYGGLWFFHVTDAGVGAAWAVKVENEGR